MVGWLEEPSSIFALISPKARRCRICGNLLFSCIDCSCSQKAKASAWETPGGLIDFSCRRALAAHPSQVVRGRIANACPIRPSAIRLRAPCEPVRNPVACGVDTIDLAQATELIRSIAGGTEPAVGGIKLGLEFFLAHGAPGVRYAFPTPVRATGIGFFLDLKLHDIPNTVAGGVRAVIELAPTYITMHAGGGRAMMRAAVEETGAQAPSSAAAAQAAGRDGADLARSQRPRGDRHRCRTLRPGAPPGALARDSGLDGVICSPHEIEPCASSAGPTSC